MATDLNPAVRTLCLTMWWGRIEKSFLFSLLWSNVRRGDPSLTSVARQLGENDNVDEGRYTKVLCRRWHMSGRNRVLCGRVIVRNNPRTSQV